MPCDYKRYPKNWPEIRRQILERAGHRCERCGVKNYAIGYRNEVRQFVELAADKDSAGMNVECAAMEGVKIIRIVLTIAHIHDPNPMNCAPENLQALCQRCHNMLDAQMRSRNAAKSRAKRKAQEAAQAGQTNLFQGGKCLKR